jgi:hypothetical protein
MCFGGGFRAFMSDLCLDCVVIFLFWKEKTKDNKNFNKRSLTVFHSKQPGNGSPSLYSYSQFWSKNVLWGQISQQTWGRRKFQSALDTEAFKNTKRQSSRCSNSTAFLLFKCIKALLNYYVPHLCSVCVCVCTYPLFCRCACCLCVCGCVSTNILPGQKHIDMFFWMYLLSPCI